MNKDAVQHERGPRNSLRQNMGIISHKNTKTLHPDLVLRQYQPFLHVLRDVNFESVYEVAAETLIKNIRWIKAHCFLPQLPISDQKFILENSWKDLFILSAANYLVQFNAISAYKTGINSEKSNEENAHILNEINIFNSILIQLAHAHIDEREYDYIRSYLLFSTVDNCNSKKQLQETSKIIQFRNETITAISTYMRLTKPIQLLRFSTIMTILEQFKKVSSETVEEFFFRPVIGPVNIVTVLNGVYDKEI